MAGNLRGVLTGVVRPGLRLWDRIPLRVQGRITVGLPLIAVCLSACMAILGNQQRVAIETDIQRKFEMSAALGDLTTLMVNAETGMRGYLLTGRSEFLEPFDLASAGIRAADERLIGLAAAEPGEKPRQDKSARVRLIQSLADRQLADLALQRSFVSSGGRDVTDSELVGHLSYGKDLMDQIRVEVGAMEDEERGLLDDRIAEINAIRVRDYVSVALALVVAIGTRLIAWYLFRKRTLHRVERLTESVRNLRHGCPAPVPTPANKDALAELEHEIDLIRPPLPQTPLPLLPPDGPVPAAAHEAYADAADGGVGSGRPDAGRPV